MAFTIALNDIIEVRLEGLEEVTRKRWNTVRHVRCMEVPTDTGKTDWDILVAIAQTFFVRVDDNVFTFLSDKWEMTIGRAKRIAPEPSIFGLYGGSAAGGVSGDVDEPDDAAVISIYSNKPGRRFQGRVFQGGLPDAAVANGVLVSTNAQDLANGWLTVLSTDIDAGTMGTFAHIIWSPTQYAVAASIEASSAFVQRCTCDKVVRRMLSREIDTRDPVIGSGV